MIQFSELRLSSDKTKIYIGCAVENFTIYNSVYIKSVYIEYYKNRLASGEPSEKAICLYENEQDDATKKSFYHILDINGVVAEDFGTAKFDNGLFYVYVTCDTNGASLATADCGWDTMTTIGIIADWQKVYQMGMEYILEVANACHKCTISDEFTNFALRWNALRLAMETCDYDDVDAIWSGLFGEGRITYNGCGCS